MATYNINTIQELINALAGASGGDIIEINSDLDWNDVYETQRNSVTVNGGEKIDGLTINGNNHTIFNITKGLIRNGMAIFDFAGCTNIKIDSLSFLNCALGQSTYCIMNCYGSCTLKNSVIQGKFKGSMFRGSGMRIRDSMITANYSTGSAIFSGQGGQNARYINCWILLDHCTFEYTGGGYFSGMDTCYIDGNLGVTGAPDDPKIFGGANNCCINCTVNPLQEPTLSGFISTASGEAGQSTNIINTDKIPALRDFESSTWVKLVTDEQMKDAEYLATIGFDIIQ